MSDARVDGAGMDSDDVDNALRTLSALERRTFVKGVEQLHRRLDADPLAKQTSERLGFTAYVHLQLAVEYVLFGVAVGLVFAVLQNSMSDSHVRSATITAIEALGYVFAVGVVALGFFRMSTERRFKRRDAEGRMPPAAGAGTIPAFIPIKPYLSLFGIGLIALDLGALGAVIYVRGGGAPRATGVSAMIVSLGIAASFATTLRRLTNSKRL